MAIVAAPESAEKARRITKAATDFMSTIRAICPEGRESRLAITNAEQGMIWALYSLSVSDAFELVKTEVINGRCAKPA